VTIKTGSEIGSGTYGKVKIAVLGEKGSTNEIVLSKTLSTSKNGEFFQTGNLDEFEFESVDVGKVC
jgi:hypothetical protein